MENLDYSRLSKIAAARRAEFASAAPYPHIVIDDFLPPDVARAIVPAFDPKNPSWDHYNHYNQRKLAITRLEEMTQSAQTLIEQLQSEAFTQFMTMLSGIEGLFADPHLDGAGLHMTLPGGHLNIHTDFLAHPSEKTWLRHLNLLIFVNPSWQEEWDGNLEMWDSKMNLCVDSIAPIFNRCVIFHTTDRSLHGHPRPLACPPGESRKSIALYYFSESNEELDLSATTYHSRPDDSIRKRFLIKADTVALKLYSGLRRYAGLRDRMISRILRHL